MKVLTLSPMVLTLLLFVKVTSKLFIDVQNSLE